LLHIMDMDGVALIKDEFILQRKPESSLNEGNSTSSADQTEIHASIKDKDHSVEGNTSDTPSQQNSSKRKKKERGQNKKRPRTVPLQRQNERLCPSLLFGTGDCNSKDCMYVHDIEQFMKDKLDDIGDRCVNFELKGKCIYGLECRFAKCHLSSDFKNTINIDKYEAILQGQYHKSELHKALLVRLRKKQYLFPKTAEYLQKIEPIQNGEGHTTSVCVEKRLGIASDEDMVKLNVKEKKKVDFSNKLYLAPLTTVGNLPFRRICKRFGADITCGEMAMAKNLLQGQQSEWALIKKHHSEDLFGVQLCGSFPDTMARCTEMLNNEVEIDFIDVNIGCPIDLVYKKGGGCALMGRQRKFEHIVRGLVEVSDVPITVKMRTGIYDKNWNAHELIPKIRDWGASLVTLHGRSREQRYTRQADWNYINQCATAASPLPLYGNGDILSFEDANLRRQNTNVAGLMIARGALIKPWIFTEIKEQRHWDISANERFDIIKEYTNYGLEHWGSDTKVYSLILKCAT